MSLHSGISNLLDSLDPDELCLLQEELAELGEAGLEVKEAFRELAAMVLDGSLLRGSTVWDFEDIGEGL